MSRPQSCGSPVSGAVSSATSPGATAWAAPAARWDRATDAAKFDWPEIERVAAASYEARRFGVRSAMSGITARRKCPELVFVRPRFDVYKAVSQQVRAVFAEHTPIIEPLSLDEAYLDVTENLQGIASATQIAEAIRAGIRRQTGLTASAGVPGRTGMMRPLQSRGRNHKMRHLIPSSTLLRAALLGDAAASGGMGLVLTAAAYPLASLLALPEPLLRGVVGVNPSWALDSLLLPLLGLAAPNGLGAAFVLLQAMAVLGFGLLQWAGLRHGAVLDAVAA